MSKFVMVIDDSPTVRKVIATTLRREGFTVECFSDGLEAMQALTNPQSQQPPPELIILDIELPKIDGYEVARRLRTKPWLAKTIIVMLSRRDSVIDKLKGRLAGAKEYLTKPFTTEQLVSAVESYLGTPTLT